MANILDLEVYKKPEKLRDVIVVILVHKAKDVGGCSERMKDG